MIYSLTEKKTSSENSHLLNEIDLLLSTSLIRCQESVVLHSIFSIVPLKSKRNEFLAPQVQLLVIIDFQQMV